MKKKVKNMREKRTQRARKRNPARIKEKESGQKENFLPAALKST